jgi:hypothetical protein
MSEFIPPVILEVKAKVTEAIVGLQKVNGEMDKLEAKSAFASGALGKFERASKMAGTALIGLGGAFVVFAAASIKQLDSFEKAQSNLETAITNTGVSFRDAQPVIQAHADAMMNLGFTYNDTYAALATMTAASGSPKMALDTLSVAADLARFKQMSLADAGRLLARASIGQAKGLGDLGIAIGKTIPKGASLATVLKAVESRAGNAAYNFKNTLSGSLQVAQANFQKLEISVGTALVPQLTKLSNWIVKTGIPKLQSFFQLVKENKGLFEGLAAALAVIWAVPKIAGFISAIQTMIKAYGALRDAALVAAAAEAWATGGINIAAGTAALAGVAAIYGGFKLKDLLKGSPSAASTTGLNAVPWSSATSPQFGGTQFYAGTSMSDARPDLKGKPYSVITPIKTTAAKTSKTSVAQAKRGTMGAGSAPITIVVNGAQNPTATGKAVVNAIKTGAR